MMFIDGIRRSEFLRAIRGDRIRGISRIFVQKVLVMSIGKLDSV